MALLKKIPTITALGILGCSYKTLQRRIKSGQITPVEKIGRDYFFSEGDVIAIASSVMASVAEYAPPKKEVIKKDKIKKIKEVEKEEQKISNDLNSSLTEDGKMIVLLLTDQLVSMGKFTEADRPSIHLASLAYQIGMTYNNLAMEIDFTDVDIKGSYVKHRYLDISKIHIDRYLSIIDKLGLTPTARERFTIPEQVKDVDPMEALLGGS